MNNEPRIPGLMHRIAHANNARKNASVAHLYGADNSVAVRGEIAVAAAMEGFWEYPQEVVAPASIRTIDSRLASPFFTYAPMHSFAIFNREIAELLVPSSYTTPLDAQGYEIPPLGVSIGIPGRRTYEVLFADLLASQLTFDELNPTAKCTGKDRVKGRLTTRYANGVSLEISGFIAETCTGILAILSHLEQPVSRAVIELYATPNPRGYGNFSLLHSNERLHARLTEDDLILLRLAEAAVAKEKTPLRMNQPFPTVEAATLSLYSALNNNSLLVSRSDKHIPDTLERSAIMGTLLMAPSYEKLRSTFVADTTNPDGLLRVTQ